MKNWILKIIERRFKLYLNSPDGSSGRTLVFITKPNKSKYNGIKISSWHRGEKRRLESFLDRIGIYPSW